jgi:hypothetical protein
VGKKNGMETDMSAIEQLKRIRDMALNKMEEIIGREEEKTETPIVAQYEEVGEETEAEEIPVVAHVVKEETEAEEVLVAAHVVKEEEGVPPEPEATKPLTNARKGRNGNVNKSELVREYFRKNPNARNQEVIDYVKEKHKIELQPSLVSTVKIAMDIPKSKRGRVKGRGKSEAPARSAVAKARAKKSPKSLPMVACVTKVISKSKSGLRIDDVVDGVEKIYDYRGGQGKKGLKNVVYQALYALSLKKNRRGWEGASPVVLHDDERHTWKLNPKAKRKIA